MRKRKVLTLVCKSNKGDGSGDGYSLQMLNLVNANDTFFLMSKTWVFGNFFFTIATNAQVNKNLINCIIFMF